MFPHHEMAVGLRCGKTNTKKLRYFARPDPAIGRDSSGRSILFSIKEESTRLPTSSPFSKKPNGIEPSRGEVLLPSARASLLKTPTGCTSGFLRVSANERKGPEARNHGFGSESCSRGLVFPQRGHHRPKCRSLVFPDGDIAGRNYNTDFDPSLEYSTNRVALF